MMTFLYDRMKKLVNDLFTHWRKGSDEDTKLKAYDKTRKQEHRQREALLREEVQECDRRHRQGSRQGVT